MYSKLTSIYVKNILLNEYSESTIREFIAKFSSDNPHVPAEQLRAYILGFEKVKQQPRFISIVKRIAPLIKQPQDLTNYSLAELQGVLRWFDQEETAFNIDTMLPEERPGARPLKLYDDGELIIYTAYTHKQAQELVRNTIPDLFSSRGGVAREGGYSYCVGNQTDSYWKDYRFRRGQTFYFVVEPKRGDCNNVLVVRPYMEGGDTVYYAVSNANNKDLSGFTWEGVTKLQPLLKGKDKLFQVRAFSPFEEIYKQKATTTRPRDFESLNYEGKRFYISLGNDIYAEDYVLLDKALQNDYINSRFGGWSTGELTKLRCSNLINLFVTSPALMSGDRDGEVKEILGLYKSLMYLKHGNSAIESFNPEVTTNKQIAKRYFELLERSKDDIFEYTYLPSKDIILLLVMSMYQSAETNNFNFKNIIKYDDILSLYSEQDLKEIFINNGVNSTFCRISQEIYKSLSDDLQKQYIGAYFKADARVVPPERMTFNVNSLFAKSLANQSNGLNFLFDVNEEKIWKSIGTYDTLSSIADNMISLRGSSPAVKEFFVEKLREYINM